MTALLFSHKFTIPDIVHYLEQEYGKISHSIVKHVANITHNILVSLMGLVLQMVNLQIQHLKDVKMIQTVNPHKSVYVELALIDVLQYNVKAVANV